MPDSFRSRIVLTAAALAAAALGVVLLAAVVIREENLGTLALIFALLAAATLATIASMALVSSRRPAQAVTSVTRALERLEAGDLGYRVQLADEGAVHELGRAFNRTAESVRNIIDDLEAERNKLSAVLETMADGVLVLDETDQVTLINTAARAFLTPPPSAGVSLISGDRLRDHELQQLVIDCREAEERKHREVQLLRGRRVLSAIATPLRDGDQVLVLLTLHDLTPMRQVETTRREFVTNVSHELRSPLASVKAMVETLEDGALDDAKRARDFLDRIHREVDRMQAIVNDLLELARIESGQAELGRDPVDLVALADEVVTGAQQRARARNVRLTLEHGESVPLALGDSGKLRQVIVNLVDNAMKFTQEGGEVAVSVAAEPEGDLLRVTVADNGPGISAEHLPHVFERFYKADRSRRDGGSGLGLAIANHIVQAHGGTIRADSVEGEGARFSFTVPRAA